MTNLFYPALAVYLQKKFPPLHPPSPPSHNIHRLPLSSTAGKVKKEHPLSLFSTPVLDSFFPYPPPLLPRLTWSGWWGRDTGQDGDEWHLSNIGGDPTGLDSIYLMRVAWADVGDVLDRESSEAEREWLERDHLLLSLAKETAESWEMEHSLHGEGCIRHLQPGPDIAEASGPCYLISPDGVPAESVTPFTQLSSSYYTAQDEDLKPVGWPPDTENIYHSLAIPFRVPRGMQSGFMMRWAESMSKISSQLDGEVFTEAKGPKPKGGDLTNEYMLSVSTMPGIVTGISLAEIVW
jgi:hypothetical protein